MSSIYSLPYEIVLIILEFAEYESCLAFASCSSEWSTDLLRNFVRKFRLDGTFIKRMRFSCDHEEMISKIKTFITDPFRQLNLRSLPVSYIPVLVIANQGVREINCKFINLFDTIHATGGVKVKTLVVDYISYKMIFMLNDCLSKIRDCESLSISFREDEIISSSPEFVCDYINKLQHLSLFRCNITDVTTLGSIPNLELRHCNKLVDISSLHNNDRILIDSCDRIEDYSQSFTNSRRIEIVFLDYVVHDIYFDLSRWTKVEDLKMTKDCIGEIVFHHHHNRLPKTLKKCHLHGTIIPVIEFTIKFNYLLNELILCNEKAITSFEGYGLERVAIIKLDNMMSLRSLQGLGRGRNRKVILSNCDEITDFSPINHIPIVEIRDCLRFKDPLQVRFVRDLTISPSTEISFQSDLIPFTPYDNNRSLNLLATTRIKSFDGLERFPRLQFDIYGFQLLEKFLKEGKQLRNQRIVLGCRYKTAISAKSLSAINHTYLKGDYHYYGELPKKKIWVRKELKN